METMIAATDNAQQCAESRLIFAMIWLQRCETSFEKPGLVYIDGHSSHVTTASIQKASRNGLQVVLEPSHNSIILQVAEFGMNRFLETLYQQECTASLFMITVTRCVFDDFKWIVCIIRTLHALKSKPAHTVDCFRRCGLLTGYNDMRKHFPSAHFSAGSSFRDHNLPQIGDTHVRAVLSFSNLADARGAPVSIPESSIKERQKYIDENIATSDGFRRFYLALCPSSKNTDNSSGQEEFSEIDALRIVSDVIRKVLKLGRALNISSGALVRSSTAFGSLVSAIDQWNVALRAKQIAIKAAANRETRIQQRANMNEREIPLVNALIEARYQTRGERLLKRTLLTLAKMNKFTLATYRLSSASSRGAVVDALVNRIQNKTHEVLPEQTENNACYIR